MENFASRVLKTLGVIILLFWQSSFAAIPPSEFLIKQYIKKRAGISQLEIKSLVTPLQANGSDGNGGLKFYETVSFDLGKLKGVSKVSAVSGGVFGQKSMILGKSESGVPEIIFSPHLSHIVQQLKAFGIGVKTEAELLQLSSEKERQAAENLQLKRDNQQIYWVIGPELPSGETPVFSREIEALNRSAWFLKDQFILGQLRSNRGRRGQAVEYKMDEFRFFQEYPYPRKIEVVVEDRPVYRIELAEMRVIPKAGTSTKGSASIQVSDSIEENIGSGDDDLDRWVRTYWNVMR